MVGCQAAIRRGHEGVLALGLLLLWRGDSLRARTRSRAATFEQLALSLAFVLLGELVQVRPVSSPAAIMAPMSGGCCSTPLAARDDIFLRLWCAWYVDVTLEISGI